MKNRKKFNEMMTAISERYEKTWGTAIIRTIWEALKPYNDEQCAAAFSHVLLRCRFWSNILPDLMEFLENDVGDSQKNVTALNQASLVLETLSSAGADIDPQFKDATTRYLMASVWPYRSWGKNLKESEVKWWRKEFIQAYKEFSKTPEQKQLSRQESLLILDKIENAT